MRVSSAARIVLLAASFFATPAVVPAAERPNIVFMLADDQGWDGLSVAMHPDIAASQGSAFHTPSLERMAAQGMRFSAAYAPSPVCSPTRASLLTGKSPAQLHWTKAAPTLGEADGYKMVEPTINQSISGSETTFAELLRSAGYATAHYGKWHLQGGGPTGHGYDESDGDLGNEYAKRFTDPNPVDIFGMAERAAAFMEKNARRKKPFFMQLSWHALHEPENALQSTLKKYESMATDSNPKRAATAAMTEDLDTGVGRVLQAIDRLGLVGNTYVIYMSDNGAGGSGKRAPLSGGKGSLWEGGIRVPLIVRGPGITPNSWSGVRVVGFDLFPTFCEWAGIPARKLPPGIEGGSIAALLKKEGHGEVKRAREELVFHFPHYHTEGKGNEGPHSAILLGNLKLIKFYETGRLALFDLSQDIGERNDLAEQSPQETTRLHERLQRYLTAVNAQMPTPNSQYDPNRPARPRGPMDGKKGPKRKMSP